MDKANRQVEKWKWHKKVWKKEVFEARKCAQGKGSWNHTVDWQLEQTE